MRIAVAGGTGLAGSQVVDELRAHGHEPVVLSRGQGVDLRTGVGLDEALRGADAIIDAVNVVTTSRAKSAAFFTATTQHLLDGARRAGVGHYVVLSIVGIDRVDFGYYEGKRRQEELALTSDVPATVLRATQFHDFPEQLLTRSPGPVALVPQMTSQTVDTGEVAAELVRLAVGPPQGLVELAGPEVHSVPDLARRVARATGVRKLVVGVPLPGAAGRAMRNGGLLPTTDGPRGTVRFEDWLATSRRSD
jgi:uncharacterized protein YbjT (DUF2867 family)